MDASTKTWRSGIHSPRDMRLCISIEACQYTQIKHTHSTLWFCCWGVIHTWIEKFRPLMSCQTSTETHLEFHVWCFTFYLKLVKYYLYFSSVLSVSAVLQSAMSRSYFIVVAYGFGSSLNREIMSANVNRTNILSCFLNRIALLFKEGYEGTIFDSWNTPVL